MEEREFQMRQTDDFAVYLGSVIMKGDAQVPGTSVLANHAMTPALPNGTYRVPG